MQRQVKAKSLSVKIPKNEPTTVRLNCVLANEEFLTLEIPRYALERFMVQAKRAIEEAPLLSRRRLSGNSLSPSSATVEEECYSIGASCSHLPRRLSGPALACMRECAHLIKAEQPGNLGYM